MALLMCPKCRNRHVDYFRMVDLAECQDCYHRFHLRTDAARPAPLIRVEDVLVSPSTHATAGLGR